MVEKTIKQNRKIWGDPETGHELRKLIFTDDTYCLRWDIYGTPEGGGKSKLACQIQVTDPSKIEKIEAWITIIQYGDSKMQDEVGEVIEQIELGGSFIVQSETPASSAKSKARATAKKNVGGRGNKKKSKTAA